jgi:hypothetical protein
MVSLSIVHVNVFPFWFAAENWNPKPSSPDAIDIVLLPVPPDVAIQLLPTNGLLFEVVSSSKFSVQMVV